MKRWENKEIEYLKNNYLLKTDNEIAKYLKKTYGSINEKRRHLGLVLPENIIIERIKKRTSNQKGKLNPNWKGGISKNNYHYKKLQIMRYPDRIKARNLVFKALKNGKIQKEVCCICGCNEVNAHHKDYTKPLAVIWLCRKCHSQVHKNKQVRNL